MIVVMTDAFTKIVRLAIIPDKTAETVAKIIMNDWIFVYGVPKCIMTDQGLEFCNKLQTQLWEELKVEHKTTTPYHPQCNSQAEVFNKTMGQYLCTSLVEAEKTNVEWELYIGPLSFAHNTAVHKATRQTPFYTMFGHNPRSPLWPEFEVLKDADYVNKDITPMKIGPQDFTKLRNWHGRRLTIMPNMQRIPTNRALTHAAHATFQT
jgi:transposase InsO family protein